MASEYEYIKVQGLLSVERADNGTLELFTHDAQTGDKQQRFIIADEDTRIVARELFLQVERTQIEGKLESASAPIGTEVAAEAPELAEFKPLMNPPGMPFIPVKPDEITSRPADETVQNNLEAMHEGTYVLLMGRAEVVKDRYKDPAFIFYDKQGNALNEHNPIAFKTLKAGEKPTPENRRLKLANVQIITEFDDSTLEFYRHCLAKVMYFREDWKPGQNIQQEDEDLMNPPKPPHTVAPVHQPTPPLPVLP
jgi:hypothetical protein